MTETKVKVRLDNRQAKSQFRDLVREGKRAAGKVSRSIRSTVGRGLGAVGFGAALGTGIQTMRSATQSGVGDVVSESFGAFGARMSDFWLGGLGQEAKASKSAREETIAAFGAIAGARNAIPPGAKQFYEGVKTLRLHEEKGRHLFEQNKDMYGPDVGDLISRIGSVIGTELSKAIDILIEKIPFVGK